jgi:hypothetical protein
MHLLLPMLLSHSQVHFCTFKWTTDLWVVYKEALDYSNKARQGQKGLIDQNSTSGTHLDRSDLF